MTLLGLKEINLSFGGVKAINDVSISVEKGSIHAVIGPNGAGKTSIFNCISGVYRPQGGSVAFEGVDITGIRPDRITRLGIARTFQNIALFQHMTVLDNLMLGRHLFFRRGVLAEGFSWGPPGPRKSKTGRPSRRSSISWRSRTSGKSRSAPCRTGCESGWSSGGRWRSSPGFFCWTSPWPGMNLEEKEDMARFILDINEERGVTILLIEHDLGVVMDISRRISVLDFGVKISGRDAGGSGRGPAPSSRRTSGEDDSNLAGERGVRA